MAPYWPAGTRLLTLIPLLQSQMTHSPCLNDSYSRRATSTEHNSRHGWDIEDPFRLMHLYRLVKCTLYKVLQIHALLVQVVLEEEERGQSRQLPLTVQGLTPSGYLKAVDQGGQLFELHPDGNR